MKTLRTAGVLAAMIALPALAGPTPPAPPTPMAIDLDFGFVLDDMLADAQSAQDSAQQWREYGEHMREYGERMRDWAHEFTDEVQGSLAIAFSDRVGHGPVVKGAPYSADAMAFLAKALKPSVGLTLLGGLHQQRAADADHAAAG